MFKRFSRNTLIAATAALIAALGVGGVSVAQNQASPSTAAKSQAAPAPTEQTTPGDPAEGGSEQNDTPDQPGDQTGEQAGDHQDASDKTGADGAGESASETPGGDGPGGHADEATGSASASK